MIFEKMNRDHLSEFMIKMMDKSLKSLFLLWFMVIGTNLFGQSLSFEDIINLQRSSLDDAKGYFNYKGWKWTGTTKDCEDCLKQGEYLLTYDKTVWTNGSERIQLLQYAGHPNAIIYHPTQSVFNALEAEAKNLLSFTRSGTEENRLWSTYQGNGQKFTFNQNKTSSNYGSTSYSVIVVDPVDLDARIDAMCTNCKGKGQVVQHESCSACSGDGRQNCRGCSGKGNRYCTSCKEGKVQCNRCWGKGNNQCNKCWGKGSLQCTKCYGKGEYNCNTCYGKGKVTQHVPGYSFERDCGSCGGKGKFSCSSCSGKGNFRCENCTGIGTVPCSGSCVSGQVSCTRCSGKYASSCTQCNGSGNTDLVCSSCSGSGQSSREIKKVCLACNGTKLKSSYYKGDNAIEPIKMPQEEEEITEFFTIVEEMPSYPGGDGAVLKYIAANTRYPEIAKKNGITGVVYVSYIVDVDGTVRDVKIVRGADPYLDEEAKRVISSIQGYSPGRQRGKAVPVQFTMPVRFALN